MGHFADPAVGGTVEIEGIRTGWLGHVRVGKVALYPDKNRGTEPFLLIEDVDLGAGLWNLATSRDRLANVRIKLLAFDAVRDKQGVIAALGFLPPTDPNAPRPPAPEPMTRIDLDAMIPRIALPFDRLRLEIATLRLRFSDPSAATPLEVTLDPANVVATWKGGATPLDATLTGDLNGLGGKLPVKGTLRIDQWTDGSQVSARNAAIAGELILDPEAVLPTQLAKLAATLGPGDPSAILDLNIAALARVAGVATTQVAAIDPIGTVSLTSSIDLADPAAPELLAILRTSNVSVATPEGMGESGTRIPAPDTTTELRAAWNLAESDRRDVSLSIFADALSVMLTEKLRPDGRRDVDARMDLEFAKLVNAANQTGLLPRPLPGATGSLGAHASAVHDDASLLSAKVTLRLQPGRVGAGIGQFLPPGYALRGDHLDLSILRTTLTAELDEPANERRAIRVSANGADAPFSLLASGDIGDDPMRDPELTISGSADAARLYGALASQIDGLPLEDVAGVLSLVADARIADGDLLTSATIALDGLRIDAPFLPGGSYSDGIALGAETRTRMGDPLINTVAASLTNDFSSIRANAETRSATDFTSSLRLSADLGEIVARFVSPTQPDLPAEVSGNLYVALNAATTDGRQFQLGLAAAPGPGFGISAAAMPLEITSFDLATSLSLLLTDNGMALELAGGRFALQDFLAIDVAASATLAGGRADIDLTTVTEFLAPEAVEFLRPLLAEMQRDQIELLGGARMETHLAAAVLLGDPMTFPRPLLVQNHLVTELPALNYTDTFGTVALEELRDERTMRVELPSPDPAGLVILENATTSLAFAELQGTASIEGANIETSATITMARGLSLDIVTAGWDRVVAKGGPATIRFPAAIVTTSLIADFARGRYDLRALDFDSPGFLSIQVSTRVDQADESAEIRGAARMTGLPEISITAADGSESPLGVIGEIDAATSGTISVAWTSGDQPALRELSGRIEAAMPRLVVGDAAGSATLDLTASVEGDLSQRAARFQLSSGMTNGSFAAMPGVERMDLRVETDLSIERGTDLVLSAFEITSRRLGTSVLVQGRINGLPQDMETYAAATSPAPLATLLTSLFFNLNIIAEQDFSRLARLLPGIQVSGDFLQAIRLSNRPGDVLAFVSTQRAVGVRAGIPGLFALDETSGEVPFAKYWRLTDQVRQPPARLDGNYYTSGIEFLHPMLMAELSRIQLRVADTRTGYEVSTVAENFFGGPGFATIRVEDRLGNPTLYGEFSLTGVDAANFLPSLSRRRLPSRSFNAFGVFSLELDDKISTGQLLEKMSLRIEFADVGAEILRESLRLMDRTGSNPGIQATLASLRFGTPRSALLDLRNGLMNFTVTMTNPAGVVYTLPVFEKVGVQGLLGAYPVGGLDANLRLTRDALALFLADDFNEIVRAIATEAPTP